jgi:hypothetical protein
VAGALGAFLVAGAGCGEGEGAADGAVLTVYVTAPLCAGAERELARGNGRAGSLRLRVACLRAGASGDRLDLGLIGASARRASEDSTAVGYVEPPGPATRFSQPILESAGIAHLTSESGARGIARLMRSVREAGDAGSVREAVAEDLDGS